MDICFGLSHFGSKLKAFDGELTEDEKSDLQFAKFVEFKKYWVHNSNNKFSKCGKKYWKDR
jgi:hypothetical protein